MLPTHYFHVVFTLPEELHDLVRHNPRLLLGQLMRLAAGTLLSLAGDPRHLGATLGVTTVLHTRTCALGYHPHVHCIVTGGGLSQDGQRWHATRPHFLLPAPLMRTLFRGRFLAALRQAYDDGRLCLSGPLAALADPDAYRRLERRLYRHKWVVYAKRPFGGPEAVLRYLGRYTHRVGITNHRLVAADETQVTFVTRQRDTVTVAPVEFLRRFCLHILPKGFVKIRHYGLVSGRRVKEALPQARRLVAATQATDVDATDLPEDGGLGEPVARDALATAASWQQRLRLLTGKDPDLCPVCGAGTLQRLPLAHHDTS